MSISGVGSANSYIYENVDKSNSRNKGTDRFGRFGVTTASNSREVSEQSSRFSAYDAYQSATANVWFRSEIGEYYIQNLERRNANFAYQAKGGLQKVDNDRYLIDVMDTIEGCWYIYDKERDERMIFNPMNTSIQTDENTGKNYIISCDPWGGLMNVMEADHELVESIKTFLQTDNVTKLNLNDKYTVEVHASTGIEFLKVKGREGYGTWFLTSEQEMHEKLQDLANLYKEKYPNIVTEDGIAMGYAEMEVDGSAVRTENGILVIACAGMMYIDNADPSKIWGVMWSINDTDVYTKIKQAMTEGIIAGSDIEDYEIWKAFFEEQEIEFEKALSDEELAAIANGIERKNGIDIIARPDGSKALEVNMGAGTTQISIGANPSFTVTSYEEIMKDWEEQVKANQATKTMTIAEATLAVDPHAREKMYSFVGSSIEYTFDEYVRQMEEQIRKLNEK